MSLFAAIILAVVFGVSAISKAIRPAETRAGFSALGLPSASALAVLVPAFEVAISMILLLSPAWGGVFAFSVLAGFTAFLVQLYRQGNPAPCRCFGAISSRPVGRIDIVRNLVLMGVALVALS